ncbi:ATP phosphoribosyltransferase regulatory subunit, partial [Mitsuokella jalaludinii]
LGTSRALEPHLFKLFDKDNRTLALRHEMTTPIARLAASRLRDYPQPLKLSYVSSAFRYEQTQAGRQCEFHQAGVELMGSATAFADAEVIALAIQGLLRAGLTDFTICLGQVEFVSGIMNQYQLADETKQKLQTALEKHDLVSFHRAIEALGLPEKAKKTLGYLPLLNGGEEMLKKSYTLALNEQSRRALDNLAEIYRLLKSYGVEQYVRFDLGIIRDFSYYTGMVFEAYTPELGFPLAGGGRYDHLLSDFGNACPATGFAIGIERILLALTRQGLEKPDQPKDVYLGYAPGREHDAIQKAQELRADGKVVELALMCQDEADAREMQQTKGYESLVYLA